MQTLISNIKHAIRNNETTVIGGGEFSSVELSEFVQKYESLRDAGNKALEALEWLWGGEPMASLEMEAIKALKSALGD